MLFLVFLWGACIGSFLNVVILRLQSEQHSFWTKRSYCFHCHKTIEWRDLVPIFSWIWLKGRCRFCHARISPRYALVEIVTGCLVSVSWLYAPDLLSMADVFVFCALLLAIGLIDLDTWLIPVPLLLILVLTSLGFGFLHGEAQFLNRLLGLLLGFGTLGLFLLLSTWILRRLGRIEAGEYAMGWGDPVLLGGIGAGLGWLSLSFVVTLASIQAVLLYGFFSWARKPLPDDKWVPPQHSMPFGPFLALAGVELSLYYLLY